MEEKFERRHIDETDQENILEMNEKASELLLLIEAYCPRSRESSLAVTKLEESMMWATKAISHN